MSSATTPFDTDKTGNETTERAASFAWALKDYTAAARVLIHDADMEQIGYWCKYESLDSSVFKEAYKHGFIPTNAGRRYRHEEGDHVGYAEFLPIEAVLDPDEVKP